MLSENQVRKIYERKLEEYATLCHKEGITTFEAQEYKKWLETLAQILQIDPAQYNQEINSGGASKTQF